MAGVPNKLTGPAGALQDQATPLYSEDQIAACVDRLAAAAATQLGRDFHVVCILTGAFLFTADLVRALSRHGCNPCVDFVALKSYGQGQTSSGTVRLVGDVPEDLGGADVLLVDDILDTGRTLDHARTLLQARHAGRILTCVLLDKPSRRETPIRADLTGFTVDDLFVVGYGIDYAEHYRHLPYLAYVKSDRSLNSNAGHPA